MSLTSSTVPHASTEKGEFRPHVSDSLHLLQLESGPPRRRSFAGGFVAQFLLLAIFTRLAMYSPKLVRPPVRQSVELIAPSFTPPPKLHLVAPRLPKVVPQPPRVEVPPPPVEAKVEPPKELPQPPVEAPKPVPAPFPVTKTPVTATPAPPAPAPPKPQVKTDVFAGSSAKPTIQAPPEKVQTGGFGDVNGFRGEAQEAKLNVPKLGAFDRPSGPGNGNGYAGAKGKPGVVASAGFGSGVAVVATAAESPGGGIHAGGFGDARAATAGGGGSTKTSAPPAMQPVEVLDKPQPQYTQEARDLKIEGEVHLKVLFQADGQVQVLQVVRGLGHGLDEAAAAAARKIRFKPAQRDGRPCDMTATVHIVFQLAS
ncbi:MAG TPA: energy transducer TonB [Terriglobales bacterium]|nr:energy transducer TonB [Terriglobales bacterium]